MIVGIPPSFQRSGFLSGGSLRPANKKHRLLLGCEGGPDSGKSEFALSAPGPGIAIVLDRGMDPVFDNMNPPKTRQPNWAFKVVQLPKETQATQGTFRAYWVNFRNDVKTACENPDCRSILIDGDSDSWELQRLAAHGKLAGVSGRGFAYTEVNAARRAFYARLWDSGKIIIATNKIKKLYKNVYNPDHTPKLDTSGNQVREWDGKSYERQGFDDQEYLWQVQIRNLYDEDKRQWGVRILKCKANKELEGGALWGSDCNFAALVQNCYPQIPLQEWGY